MTRHISLATIREAAQTVYDVAVRTPLIRLEVPGLDARGPEIFLKLESLQPIGSFKIRGAWNAVRRLTPDQLAQGVWTVSAGNAAQGVALAARRAGAACSVMVMDTAPATKLRSIERLGARIVQAPYAECWQTVERHGSDRMTGHFVHPFDDDHFISGNGTIGLEIFEDLPDVDAVIAPIGGGGLLAGIGAALRELRPEAKIYAAEPETAAPLARSLEAGAARAFPEWTSSFV
ncbi:MAG: pyridoxal-phosphate dependent enzyme, partial [Vicinamibacterales bacterium]